MFIVELAALLHDVGDYKFFQGDKEVRATNIREWLSSLEISSSLIDKIVEITSQISFMRTLPDIKNREEKNFVQSLSKELVAACDADRLDVIRTVGIARAFTYDGFYKRPIYEPAIKPNKFITCTK